MDVEIKDTASEKLAFIVLGIIALLIANEVWSGGGYINLLTELSTWLLLILSFISFLLGTYIGNFRKDYIFIIILLSMLIILVINFIPRFPIYGTDEIYLDYQAAISVLHGINPYSTKFVFVSNQVLPYYVTPKLSGGIVDTLVYPALSFLILIPNAIMRLEPSVTIVIFNILSFIILFIYYKQNKIKFYRNGKESSSLLSYGYAALALLVNINWVFFSIGGVTDIVWVDFLALSYVFRKRPYISGIFMGLAVCFKQIAALILPFYVIFLHMEEFKKEITTFKFLFAMFLSFLIPNLPFIILSPMLWFKGVVGIVTQPIVEVGMGISAINFTGLYVLGRDTFFILPASLFIILLYVYRLFYVKLKFTFFSYPVIIFLLYNRLLFSYLIYWPFLILLLLPDIISSYNQETKQLSSYNKELSIIKNNRHNIRFNRSSLAKLSVIPIIILITTSIIFIYIAPAESDAPLSIISVSYSNPFLIEGYVSKMTLKLVYDPSNNQPYSLPLNFRIFPYNPTDVAISTNGLIWLANSSIIPGINTISLLPASAIDLLNLNNKFTLVGYYGNIRVYYSGKFESNQSSVPFQNPTLSLPLYYNNLKEYPYGWVFVPNNQAGKASYVYKENLSIYRPGILTLSINRNGNVSGWAASQLIQYVFNLTELSQKGCNYSYKISDINSSISDSSIVSAGWPLVAYGSEITFNGGQDQVWWLYSKNNSFSYYQPSGNLVVILTNQTKIDFRYIEKIALANHWDISSSDFMFIVGSTIGKGFSAATFSSFNLACSSSIEQQHDYSIAIYLLGGYQSLNLSSLWWGGLCSLVVTNSTGLGGVGYGKREK